MDYWAGDTVWILQQQQNTVANCKQPTPGTTVMDRLTEEFHMQPDLLSSCPVSSYPVLKFYT